ncbi:Type 1 glutamine amidotransferase-like domain-containing protein [Oceanobacillus saliphilus]|uniref:Type 1 glutamine amidotransferase-like domain-containing protein n=1 Tax=Oceanobacillus saliphilus TaxID=2925834 RepID=UPI00201E0A71|nr:Type 1 glutamine amidotransferase-like domain-containing protein [Oceanobacillus saliphilus]
MNSRHLFLFGGSPPFSKKLGKKFADIAIRGEGKVAILFLERDGWEKYMPKYTSVLKDNGIDEFVYLPLSPKPNYNTLKVLTSCTGIIIGGGETELYRSYIVDTRIGELIKELYQQGVPVAGFSAGALIIPANCVIPPIDNSQNKHLFLKGLGLIKDCVISVHYTKWEEEENLKAALIKLNATIGYGIDDEAALYFVNESVLETGKFHKFENVR